MFHRVENVIFELDFIFRMFGYRQRIYRKYSWRGFVWDVTSSTHVRKLAGVRHRNPIALVGAATTHQCFADRYCHDTQHKPRLPVISTSSSRIWVPSTQERSWGVRRARENSTIYSAAWPIQARACEFHVHNTQPYISIIIRARKKQKTYGTLVFSSLSIPKLRPSSSRNVYK